MEKFENTYFYLEIYSKYNDDIYLYTQAET